MHSLALLLMFPALVTTFVVWLVLPLVKDMEKVEDILCEGDLGVLQAIDKMGMLWLFKPDAYTRDLWNSMGLNMMQSAVFDAIHDRKPELGNLALVHPFEEIDIRTISSKGITELAGLLNYNCDDVLLYGSYLRYTQNRLRTPAIQSCADVAPICMDLRFLQLVRFLRILCPRECGCTSPTSIVADHRPAFGCPSSCPSTVPYTSQLRLLNCTDSSPQDLRSSPYWPVWMNNVVNPIQGPVLHNRSELKTVEEHGLLEGCGMLLRMPKDERVKVCEGTSEVILLRPLSPICPQTCGCATGSVRNCAPQCTPLFNPNFTQP